MAQDLVAVDPSMVALLLGSADALVGIKAPDGRYLYANPALERFLGAGRGGLAGRLDDELPQAELAREVSASLAGPSASLERSIRLADAIRIFSVRHHELRSDRGELVGSGFVAVDITPRVEAEQQALRALQDEVAKNDALRAALADLQSRATTDRLTGAWNRGRLEEAAHAELDRLRRYGHPVSLVFFDLDHFKQVNDTYGHAAGDRVLTAVAAAVRGGCRVSDALARWGGEEFVVLAPNTGLDGAAALAQRLRMAVRKVTLPELPPVTASFGVAECTGADTWETWLQRADEAAYRAKGAGRDRVEVSPSPSSDSAGVEGVGGGFVRLVWHTAYDSGNATIDLQHRAMFRHANNLLRLVLESRPGDEVGAAIDGLLLETANHFRTEEEIFRAAGYPDADRHAFIHAQLLAVAKERSESFRRGAVGVGALFQFLAHDVVTRHMLAEDRRFFPFLGHTQAR